MRERAPITISRGVRTLALACLLTLAADAVASYAHAGTGTSVDAASFVASSSAAGARHVTYTVTFSASAGGSLAAGEGAIRIAAPGAGFPDGASGSYAVTNATTGASGTASASTAPGSAAITSPVDIHGGDHVRVVVLEVVNRATAGPDTVTVSTSGDPEGFALPFVLADPAVVLLPSVAVEIPVAGAAHGDYVISFNTSAGGGLVAGRGTIEVSAPAGTVFSGSYTIRDAATGARSDGWTGSGAALNLITPIDIGGDHPVVIILWDVVNKPSAGAHALSIRTSSDTLSTRTGYALVKSAPVGAPAVTLSDRRAGASGVTYDVAFTTSPHGHLPAYLGTITVAGPAGTVFGWGRYTLRDLTTGVTTEFWAGSGGAEVTFNPLTDVGRGDKLRISISNVANISRAGAYRLSMSTSADRRKATTPFTLAWIVH